jgi:hypothetical protein
MKMKTADVTAVLSRVLLWPPEAQKEAIGALRAIEHDWFDDGYHTTPEDLTTIDEADRGELATDEEIEVAFSSSRSGKA